MSQKTKHPIPDSIEDTPGDLLIESLKVVIRFAVRALAVLMTFVIVMGVVDMGYIIYNHMLEKPYGMLTVNDIFESFGEFMTVLIAIELFVNITVYLKEHSTHVKVVMATAVMAVARKVVIMDLDKYEAAEAWALASVTLAVCLGYYLVVLRDQRKETERPDAF